MSLISLNIKQQIVDNLNNILNIQDSTWNNLDTEIKLKIIHNLCNTLNKQSDILNTKITIPLKNLRPKKIIQFCGINKQSNSIIYDNYRKKIVNINKDFRNNYNSSNKNYCFANLSKNKYDLLLNNFNYDIYTFLNSNINSINSKLFYSNLIGENNKKVISTGYELNFDNTSIQNNNNISEIYDTKISDENKSDDNKSAENISADNKSSENKSSENKSADNKSCKIDNLNKKYYNLKIKQINYKDKFLNIEFNNNTIFEMELYLTSEKITNNIPAKYKINLINIF